MALPKELFVRTAEKVVSPFWSIPGIKVRQSGQDSQLSPFKKNQNFKGFLTVWLAMDGTC